MTKAGELDKLITFIPRTTTVSSTGAVTETYDEATAFKLWGHEKGIPARERFLSDAEHSVRSAFFFVRWHKSINQQMRMIVDGRDYNILGIIEVGNRRDRLEISAEAIEKEKPDHGGTA